MSEIENVRLVGNQTLYNIRGNFYYNEISGNRESCILTCFYDTLL